MTQMIELPNPVIQPAFNPMPGLTYHRVVLVSSQPLFLVGLREELNRYQDFKVIGEVSTAPAVMELVNSGPVGLIIVDQARPGESHLLIKVLLRRLEGRVPLVVLGSSEGEIEITDLRQAGVKAFASKALDGGELCNILRQAVQDRRPLPGVRVGPAISQIWPAPSYYQEKRPVAAVEARDKMPLSPREMQILEAIAQGRSNKEVAQLLCISAHTLKNHLNNIFKKLDVEDRTQALMLSVRNGWVRL